MGKYIFMEYRQILHKEHRFKLSGSLFYGIIELREAPEHLLGSNIFIQVEGVNVAFGKQLEPMDTIKGLRERMLLKLLEQNNGKREVYFLTFLIGRRTCYAIV